MKTSVKMKSDNNYYEFVVGNCINKIKEYFPNFLMSFNYLNISEDFKNFLKDQKEYTNIDNFIKNTNLKSIQHNELQNNTNIENGCVNNDKSSIFIEYIPNSVSFMDLSKITNFTSNLNVETYNILFQLYGTLNALRKVYTHYDLHTDNVMFVEVPDKKKIKIEYKLNDKTYEIYTSFIPVILDYGRSFVDCLKIDDVIYSKIFSEVACDNPKCNKCNLPKCNTEDIGLKINRDKEENYSKQDNFYNINLRSKNESSDLRYLHLFMKALNDSLIIKKEYNIYAIKDKSWLSRDKIGHVSVKFGVKENLENIRKTGQISNITDCFEWLVSIYTKMSVDSVPIENLYGVMTINFNFEEKTKWTFTTSATK
jgi:hypothetical protein